MYRSILKVLSPLCSCEERWQICGLSLILLSFLVSDKLFNVLNSFVNRDWTTALVEYQMHDFWYLIIAYILLSCLIGGLATLIRYLEQRLSLLIRTGITSKLIIDNGSYKHVDNQDQRIAEDTKIFANFTVSLTVVLISNIIGLIAFFGVLLSISYWLVIASLAYAIIGTLLSIFIGKPLVKLNFEQSKLEANFRRSLIDNDIIHKLRNYFLFLSVNLKDIFRLERNLSFLSKAFEALNPIIPIILIAPYYFNSQVSFGVIIQTAIAWSFVVNSFSMIVSQFLYISVYLASVKRLEELMNYEGN